jgi:hypothetical protein
VERARLRFRPGNIRLIGMALILMLLGSFFIVTSPRRHFYVPREQRPHNHSISFNVSLSNFERIYPIEPLTHFGIPTRIGITNVKTNETTVGLAIQNGNNVSVFTISSVSKITNCSLVVEVLEDFKIIVTRETGDANGSFVIMVWEIMPPPPEFDPIVIGFYYGTFFLLGFAAFVFWKIVTMKTSQRSIRPIWVVIWVVFGLIMVVPYVNGSLGGYFTPTEMTEQVYSDTRTLALDEANPNSLYTFGIEAPNTAESFRIHSFEDDNKRYHFELLGANGEALLSATHENSSRAWEIIGGSVIQEHILKLDRVDSDAEVSLSIEASGTTVIIPVDPLPDLILAVIGFVAFTLAIVTSLVVETVEKVRQN